MGSLGAARRGLARAVIDDDEFPLAGKLTAACFSLGGVTLAVMTRLPGIPRAHQVVLFGLAAACVLGAPVLLRVVPWHASPQWVIHPIQASGLVCVAIAVASSGGSHSPAWIYLLLSGMFAAYFYRRAVALAYLFACVAVQSLPLLYDSQALHDRFLATLLVAAPVYVGIGVMISEAKRRMLTVRRRAEMLAAEQGALRRVATAVVDGRSAQEIYDLVALEVSRLLRCGGAGIMRLSDGDCALVVGAYGEHDGAAYQRGTVIPLAASVTLEEALATGRPMRVDRHPAHSAVAQAGYLSTIVAPVTVAGRRWGLLAVADFAPGAFGPPDEETLLEFGELLATAIASTEERARLAEQALSDSLTGLANQRALQARLAGELARAARHGRPVAVAIIDIDHFKEVNDAAGHDVGDAMLVRVAAALQSFARTEDTLGRLGGDEFAWVLPDTTREQALVAVERARRLIAAAPPDPHRVTISAGICDTDSASDANELLRLADSALYWSKAHGRNQTWIYDPALIDELSEHERAQRLERAQAVQGLRTLVRSYEARDPATREHSERVAVMAGLLAGALGWARADTLALSEAALLHDVACLADEAPLPRASGLEETELDELAAAARRSARIAEPVLSVQQAGWIAAQWERRDGAAPDRHVPLDPGPSLIALADAWDSLTAVAPGLPGDVVGRLERLAGGRLHADAVRALVALYEAGELRGGPSGESIGRPA